MAISSVEHGQVSQPGLKMQKKKGGGAWESVNKLEREKGEENGGGLIQGDRSVNHQWLRFILPPLSKTFKGGFVYLLPQTGAGNLGNRKPSASPNPPTPPPLLSYTSPVPLPPPLRHTHTHTPDIHPFSMPSLLRQLRSTLRPALALTSYPEWACCAQSLTPAAKVDKGMLVPQPAPPPSPNSPPCIKGYG